MDRYTAVLAMILLASLPLLALIWVLVRRDDRTAQDEERMAAVIKALLLERKPKAGVDE